MVARRACAAESSPGGEKSREKERRGRKVSGIRGISDTDRAVCVYVTRGRLSWW